MKTNQNKSATVAVLVLSALMSCSIQSAVAQGTAPASDTLAVNYTGKNGVNVKTTVNIPEVNPERTVDVDLNPAQSLPKNGMVVFFEPDGKTLSDLLICVTGSSLQFYSDGNPDLKTVYDFYTTGGGKGTVPLLGSFNETANGLTKDVSALYGAAANSIVITSDGNVPDNAATAFLFAVGLLGLIGYRRALKQFSI